MVDLFSGAGGTGIGFREAGFRIVGAVEIDRDAAKTYEKNLGVKVKLSDIRDFTPEEFRKELNLRRGELDVLVGCPPCQGFSRMRNSDGVNDPRNDLVIRYLDFVKVFIPRFAVFENVPGLVRSKHGKKFYDELYAGLEELGYKVAKEEKNAADYGVPQHRRRVIVVAGRAGENPPFPKPTHGNPNSPEVRDGYLLPWLNVRDAIGKSKYPYLKPGQSGERKGKYPNHIAPNTGDKVLRFIKQVPKNGGSRTDVPKEFWLECHLKHGGHVDVYGRLAWNRPSNTITCGCVNVSKGRFVHPGQNRALTPREAARLQGFPDEFVFVGKTICKQVGNAVPPPLAYALARVFKKRILTGAQHRSRYLRRAENTVRLPMRVTLLKTRRSKSSHVVERKTIPRLRGYVSDQNALFRMHLASIRSTPLRSRRRLHSYY
ncbi:MAG TPA: DNA cytosine methyltransferase [Pyrinomonadaceae bacterium]